MTLVDSLPERARDRLNITCERAHALYLEMRWVSEEIKNRKRNAQIAVALKAPVILAQKGLISVSGGRSRKLPLVTNEEYWPILLAVLRDSYAKAAFDAIMSKMKMEENHGD